MHVFDILIAGKQIPVTPSLALITKLEDELTLLPVMLQQMQDKELKLAVQRDILKRVAEDSGVPLTDHDLETHLIDQGMTGIAREVVKILSALVAGIKAIDYFTGGDNRLGKPENPPEAAV